MEATYDDILDDVVEWRIKFRLHGDVWFPKPINLREVVFWTEEKENISYAKMTLTTSEPLKSLVKAEELGLQKINAILCAMAIKTKQRLKAEIIDAIPVTSRPAAFCAIRSKVTRNISLLVPIEEEDCDKIAKISRLYEEDESMKRVVTLLNMENPYYLPNLYNIYEIIESDVDGKFECLAANSKITKFTSSVNNVDVVGIEHARHGKKLKGSKYKKLPEEDRNVHREECRKIMAEIICKWFKFKIAKEV